MSRPSVEVLTLKSDAPLSEAELGQLTRLVQDHAGIVLQAGSPIVLREAVASRMFQLGLEDHRAYLDRLTAAGDRAELQAFLALLTVQKTSFFRDRLHFDLLEQRLLPRIAARQAGTQGRRLNVWSAGCSTGEEPYSISLLLRRAWPSWQGAAVLATDLSLPALTRAKHGRYREQDLAPLRPEERAFFEHDGECWRPKRELSAWIEFKVHNLVSPVYPTPNGGLWDIIFCRNVLIYFSRETVRGVIRRFLDVLAPGGLLFVGASESILQLAEGFELLMFGDAFVYQKIDRAASAPRPIAGPAAAAPATTTASRSAPIAPRWTPRAEAPRTEPDPGLLEGLREARVRIDTGPEDEAFRRLFELTSKHPAAIEPYLELAQLALDGVRLDEALSWYQVATEVAPLHTEARFLLAVVFHRLGRNLEAAEELRRLLFLDGGFALGHYYLGLVAGSLGDLDTALRSYRNALRSLSGEPGAVTAELLGRHGMTNEALAAACHARLAQISPAAAGGEAR